jgi:hypothetical protein
LTGNNTSWKSKLKKWKKAIKPGFKILYYTIRSLIEGLNMERHTSDAAGLLLRLSSPASIQTASNIRPKNARKVLAPKKELGHS